MKYRVDLYFQIESGEDPEDMIGVMLATLEAEGYDVDAGTPELMKEDEP